MVPGVRIEAEDLATGAWLHTNDPFSHLVTTRRALDRSWTSFDEASPAWLAPGGRRLYGPGRYGPGQGCIT